MQEIAGVMAEQFICPAKKMIQEKIILLRMLLIVQFSMVILQRISLMVQVALYAQMDTRYFMLKGVHLKTTQQQQRAAVSMYIVPV